MVSVVWKDPPFVMCAGKDICYPNETKNSHLEGFLIDMIQEIANHKTMKFKYELYLSPDGNYGSKNAIGEWNGMIKELMLGVRHSISLTYNRIQYS